MENKQYIFLVLELSCSVSKCIAVSCWYANLSQINILQLFSYLSCRVESVPKVNADQLSGFHVNHKVREMTVTNTKYILANTQYR